MDSLLHFTVLLKEIKTLQEKYDSMDHDCGRYNTAINVLTERAHELEQDIRNK